VILVNSTCMVVDGETPSPLQQIDIHNDPNIHVASCVLIHEQILFEHMENDHANCKIEVNLLNL
jgi:hypothetical protein